MNFNENLVKLRKQNQMSQDALAEKLNVSRQTIYKWEMGATYPDMDKLMDIAKIFNISIDKLINEEINEENVSKDEIIKRYNVFSTAISFSVALIIFSVAILIFCSTFGETPTIIGLVIMLSLIFAGVIIIVFQALNFEAFKKENNINTIEVTKLEITNARNAFTKGLIIGLILIFAAVIQLIFFSITDNDTIMIYSVCALLTLIASGSAIIVKYSCNYELFEKPEKALKSDEKEDEEKSNPLYAIIFIIATIVFLIWGFVFNAWHINWISFAVAALLCGIVAVLSDFYSKKKID